MRNVVPEREPLPDRLPAGTDTGIVNPRTGEIVTDSSSDDDVIDLLKFIRDCREVIDELDGEVSQWLRARADMRKKWTLAGGRASMPSNRPDTAWSLAKLRVLLPQLVDAGHITQRDADACLQTTVVVVSAEVNRLKDMATPAIAEALMECRVEVPKTSRRVKLR